LLYTDQLYNVVVTGRKTSKINYGLLPAFSYPPVCYGLHRPIIYEVVFDKLDVFYYLFRKIRIVYFNKT
jgi:hypothetical protein